MDVSFETVIENAPDAITRLDPEGRFQLVNRKAERFMDLSRDRILGKTHRELGFPDKFMKRFDADFRCVCDTKEHQLRTFSYRGRYFEASMVPEVGGDGTLTGVTIFTRDVNDREEHQRILTAQRDYAMELIKSVQEPMLVLDDRLRVTSANPVFRQITGLSEEELVDRPLREVIDPLDTDLTGLRNRLMEILKDGSDAPAELEVNLDLPEEGPRQMLCHASQIDSSRLILFSLRDITDHRREVSDLEDDLRTRNRELSLSYRKLKALLVELSETEDRERKRLADLLHDEVQQLLVGLGFQLKVLREDMEEGSETDRLLDEAESLLKRTVDMTRDLSHDLSPVGPPDASMEQALQYLATQMEELHGLQVNVDVSGDIKTPSASVRALLVKAVKEMLLNIVKHADVKEARLELGMEDGTMYVWVRDHGKGFNAEEVLRKPGGGGLGLFSIRERLHALGGRLEVDSSPGKGSRFRLEIPVGDENMEMGEAELSDLDRTLFREGTDLIRLVLVDDHAAMRESLAHYLNRHPRIEVVGQAADGKEGVVRVETHRPDVVLMDLAMPEMTGATATREIKERYPDTRVVGLSMFPKEDLEASLREVGMDAFVQKTALLTEVFEVVLPGKTAVAEL